MTRIIAAIALGLALLAGPTGDPHPDPSCWVRRLLVTDTRAGQPPGTGPHARQPAAGTRRPSHSSGWAAALRQPPSMASIRRPWSVISPAGVRRS